MGVIGFLIFEGLPGVNLLPPWIGSVLTMFWASGAAVVMGAKCAPSHQLGVTAVIGGLLIAVSCLFLVLGMIVPDVFTLTGDRIAILSLGLPTLFGALGGIVVMQERQ